MLIYSILIILLALNSCNAVNNLIKSICIPFVEKKWFSTKKSFKIYNKIALNTSKRFSIYNVIQTFIYYLNVTFHFVSIL